MLNFNGKPLSYQPGREVPNKEPPVSRFVVEQLYRVHRQRVLSMQAIVHTKVHIPDFLTETAWKQAATAHKHQKIAKENEAFYKRLLKRENEESQLTKSTKEHIKVIDQIKSHATRLKEAARLREVAKIRRENEMLMERINKAIPEYTNASIKQWYSHHVHFKEGRRADPTAGHIMKGMSDIAPNSLPSLGDDYSVASRSIATQHSSVTMDNSSMASGNASNRSIYSRNSRSSISASASSSYLTPLGTKTTAIHDKSLLLEVKVKKKKRKSKRSKDDSISNDITTDSNNNTDAVKATTIHSKAASVELSNDTDKAGDTHHSRIDYDTINDEDSMILLAERSIIIPFDNHIYYIKIFITDPIDDTVHVRLYNRLDVDELLYNRSIPLEKAYDITRKNRQSIMQIIEDNDSTSLYNMLSKMFTDADADRSGFLSFSEFQELLTAMNLQASPHELRAVISQVDEDNNGVVDFSEYMNLSVDLLLSFKSKHKATSRHVNEKLSIEMTVNANNTSDDLDAIIEIVTAKCKEVDYSNSGSLSVDQLKSVLIKVSSVGITDTEVNLVCERLPDNNNKKVYTKLGDVLRLSKYIAMKNTIIKEKCKSSELTLSLLKACEECELANRRIADKLQYVSGFLDHASLKVAIESFKMPIPLQKLQLMVVLTLLSDTNYDNTIIDYYDVIPVVADTVHNMTEKKQVSLRNKLLEYVNAAVNGTGTGTGTDAVTGTGTGDQLNGMHVDTLNAASTVASDAPSDAGTLSHGTPKTQRKNAAKQIFHRRFGSVLKQCDVDSKSTITVDVLKRIAIALDLKYDSEEDYENLLHKIKTHTPSQLSFEHVSEYFMDNLSVLERDKHLKQLSHDLHDHKHHSSSTYAEHLRTIFEISDTDNSGFLDHHVFEDVISQLHVDITTVQLDILLSELHHTIDGKINWTEFIPVCVDLLEAIEAKEMASEEHNIEEAVAREKAVIVVHESIQEIHQIVRYLESKLMIIQSSIDDDTNRLIALKEALKCGYSHLSKTEANSLLNMLFRNNKSFQFRTYDDSTRVDKGKATSMKRTALLRRSGSSSSSSSSSGGGGGKYTTVVYKKVIHGKNAITHKELHDTVYEVRVLSIMRNFLSNHMRNSKGKIADELMKLLQYEALSDSSSSSSSSGVGSHDNTVTYISTSSVYKALEGSSSFRLHRPQIIGLLNQADCYNASHTKLRLKDFIDYAATELEKILSGATHDAIVTAATAAATTASASAIGSSSSSSSSYGKDDAIPILESELDEYLNTMFTEYEIDDNTHEIHAHTFLEIIKNIPKLHLSSKESSVIIAGYPMLSSGNYYWVEFLEHAHQTVVSLLNERRIAKRTMDSIRHSGVSNATAAIEESESLFLKKLEVDKIRGMAGKFIDNVRLKFVRDVLVIELPDDKDYGHTTKASKGSTQSKQTAGSTHMSSLRYSKSVGDNVTEIPLLRTCLFMPLHVYNKSKVEVKSVLMKIFTIERDMFASSELIASLVTADGMYSITQLLPYSISSVGVCDKETAEEFAVNALATMHLQLNKDGTMTLLFQ